MCYDQGPQRLEGFERRHSQTSRCAAGSQNDKGLRPSWTLPSAYLRNLSLPMSCMFGILDKDPKQKPETVFKRKYIGRSRNHLSDYQQALISPKSLIVPNRPSWVALAPHPLALLAYTTAQNSPKARYNVVFGPQNLKI